MSANREIAIGFGTAALFPSLSVVVGWTVTVGVDSISIVDATDSASMIFWRTWTLRDESNAVVGTPSTDHHPVFTGLDPNSNYTVELDGKTKSGVPFNRVSDVIQTLDEPHTPPSEPTGLAVVVNGSNAEITIDEHPDTDEDLLDQVVFLVTASDGTVDQAITLGGQPAILFLSPTTVAGVFQSLEPGTYYARAYARDNSSPPNLSTVTAAQTVTILPPVPASPAAPSNVTAVTNGVGRVDVAWTNNAVNADSIEVHRVSPHDVNFTPSQSTLLATLGAAVAAYPDFSVATSATPYSYRIVARNANPTPGISAGVNVTSAEAPPSGVQPAWRDDFTTYADAAAMNAAYLGGGFTNISLVTINGSAGPPKKCARYTFPAQVLGAGFNNDQTIKHRKDFPPNVSEAWIEEVFKMSLNHETGIPNRNFALVDVTAGSFQEGDACTLDNGGTFTCKPVRTTTYPGATHYIPFTGLNKLKVPAAGAILTNNTRAGTATVISIDCGSDNSDYKHIRIHPRSWAGQAVNNYFEFKIGLGNARGVYAHHPGTQVSTHDNVGDAFSEYWTDQWIRLRYHCRLNSAQGVADGTFKIWKDDAVLKDYGIINLDYGKLWYIGFGENRNQRQVEDQTKDYDYRQFYLTNPGW